MIINSQAIEDFYPGSVKLVFELETKTDDELMQQFAYKVQQGLHRRKSSGIDELFSFSYSNGIISYSMLPNVIAKKAHSTIKQLKSIVPQQFVDIQEKKYKNDGVVQYSVSFVIKDKQAWLNYLRNQELLGIYKRFGGIAMRDGSKFILILHKDMKSNIGKEAIGELVESIKKTSRLTLREVSNNFDSAKTYNLYNASALSQVPLGSPILDDCIDQFVLSSSIVAANDQYIVVVNISPSAIEYLKTEARKRAGRLNRLFFECGGVAYEGINFDYEGIRNQVPVAIFADKSEARMLMEQINSRSLSRFTTPQIQILRETTKAKKLKIAFFILLLFMLAIAILQYRRSWIITSILISYLILALTNSAINLDAFIGATAILSSMSLIIFFGRKSKAAAFVVVLFFAIAMLLMQRYLVMKCLLIAAHLLSCHALQFIASSLGSFMALAFSQKD